MKRQMEKIRVIFYSILLMLLIFNFLDLPCTASAASVIPAPSSVRATARSYNSISVSWRGVTGVSGYQVYRATSINGTYTLVSTTTGGSYTNTGLTTGTSYYYKVRAYRNVGNTKVYGNYSSIVSTRPLPGAPSSVRATARSYNSISVSWGVVTAASGYQVYRATSINGTYILVSTTTGGSYTNTGLTTGTSYYYKVRAYRNVGNTKVYGNYSSIVSTRPLPGAPSSVKATSSSYTSIDLSWGGATEASGFEIYRSASSNGTYTLISTTAERSYTDTGLDVGTTYYYKVRAYRIVGSTKVYSNFSSAASGTTDKPIVNVTSVSLNKTAGNLTAGSTETLIPIISPSNATNKEVMWTSSNNYVAVVDDSGRVTAVGEGTAIITVITVDGNKTANYTVTVTGKLDTGDVKIKGIDVSKWQGKIDWSLVKSDGVQFAMIRSSYGKSSIDPYFETNYAGAKANGVAVGAYHYSYATTVNDAVTEANFFVSQLKGKQFEYPVCVDIEDPSQSKLDKKTVTEIALTYLEILKESGYYPMIYANKAWYTSMLDDALLTSYDHWLAQWGSTITYTGAVGMWQYTSDGSVKGINGRVDMDTSFIDYASKIKALHLNGF